MKTGNISINTENIFPIIKKWLYSDKDIFIRELVSNACDAITKLKKIASSGEAVLNTDNFEVNVIINKEEKTLTFTDNGIGMTADEVVKYIAEIAFSGAEEFIRQYEEKPGDENVIIGHFGLGFYSAFMVAESVDIKSLSYKEGAKGVLWSCDGGTEYTIEEIDKSAVGTEIVLHIAEDSEDFLEESTVRGVLDKYCAFMPFNVYLCEQGKDKPEQPINDTKPLWLKKPSECTAEEYNEFYKKVFNDYNDPLFYIHLNVEYPFNLKGILYFPKLKNQFETMDGQIKLFNNQVFVADNIKEVIPEFLLLLKGCIDCPDLPLNVSRSFLQNDGYVSKVSAHITKKVADKLTGMFNTDRDSFNGYWDDINPFVKFGCLRDEKFYEKVKNILIFKTLDGEYKTLADCLDDAKAENHENEIYYVSDELQQGQYIELFKNHGISAVMLPGMLDNHFISFEEMHNNGLHFSRIDSAIASGIKGEENTDGEKVGELFKEAIADEKLKIETAPLGADDAPAVLLLGEQSRRMSEMAKLYGGMPFPEGMFAAEYTLSINTSSPVIKSIADTQDKDMAIKACKQVYDMARIAQAPLDSASLKEFIKRSAEIMNEALSK